MLVPAKIEKQLTLYCSYFLNKTKTLGYFITPLGVIYILNVKTKLNLSATFIITPFYLFIINIYPG